MTIQELIPALGINPENITKIIGNVSQEIIPGAYNRIQVVNIRLTYFDNDSQCVRIYPAVPWTDGTCRPTYDTTCGAHVHLNKRILPVGDQLHSLSE